MAVGAAAIISFLIMVMIVRERKREVGILKAIGGPNRRIMCQFMTEALTFSVLAGVAGLLTGALAAGSITASLVRSSGSSRLHTTASAPDILIGLAGILLIAAFGSAAASYLISRIRPAEALRSE